MTLTLYFFVATLQESYLLKNLSLKINNNKKQTQEQNPTHSFTIFKGKWNITHTDSWATLGASPHWPSKLKSGKSSSSLLWWKTLIGLLLRICTIWMIPFEEYVFDISFSLFSLRQLKANCSQIFWYLTYQFLIHRNFWIFSCCIGSAYNICNSPISRWSFLSYLWTFLCNSNLLHRYGKFEYRQS